MGKTIAVLCYGFSAFAALAAVALTWLAARAYHGTGNISSASGDTVLMLSIGAVFCLLFAGVFFVVPTLRERYPWLGTGQPNPYFDHADQPKTLSEHRKRLKTAMLGCPPGIRALRQACRWSPLIILILLGTIQLISRYSSLPGFVQPIETLFLRLASVYGPLPLLFVLFLTPQIPLSIIEYRAIRAYKAEKRHRELHPVTCPDCGYPIDTGNPSTTCPECGFDRSPAGAKTP